MLASGLGDEITQVLNDGKKFTNRYLPTEMMNTMQQKTYKTTLNSMQEYKAPPSANTVVNPNALATIPVYKKSVTVTGEGDSLNTVLKDYGNGIRYFTDEIAGNIGIGLKI